MCVTNVLTYSSPSHAVKGYSKHKYIHIIRKITGSICKKQLFHVQILNTHYGKQIIQKQ